MKRYPTNKGVGAASLFSRGALAGLAAAVLAALAQPVAAMETRPVEGVTAELKASNIRVREGEEAVFTFVLSRPFDFSLRYAYRTQDGSAKAGKDYQARQGYVVFPAGKRLAQVRVRTLKDDIIDNDHFRLVLSGAETHGYGMVWGQYVWTGRWVVSGLPETRTVRASIRNVWGASQGRRAPGGGGPEG